MHAPDTLPPASAGSRPLAVAINAIFAVGVAISSEFFTGLGAVASIIFAGVAASRDFRQWLDRRRA